jgi:hypothetical protein
VYALKDKAPLVVLEGENPLATQNVRAFFLYKILNPREKLVGVEKFIGTQRDRLHLFVVVVL